MFRKPKKTVFALPIEEEILFLKGIAGERKDWNVERVKTPKYIYCLMYTQLMFFLFDYSAVSVK